MIFGHVVRRVSALLALTVIGASPVRADLKADAVVATDGSGNFTSVQDAISAAPMRTGAGDPPWVIFVKAGRYHERIYVQRERGNIVVRGEDVARTVITYGLHAGMPGPDGKPIGTFRTPTVQVDGDGMTWENVTIENDAGPVGQAVALRVDGDRVVFRHCRLLGWQDTLLANRGRQYFADCEIEGHVDFIFGGATAYFDHCRIGCRGNGYVTAASTPQGQPHGFVFADCMIDGAAGVGAYLGRPWRDYAQVVFLRTEMSEVIRPEGWHNWNKPAAEKSARFAEFACTGPGAKPAARVPWEHPLESGDSARFTPEKVLGGADGWRPVAGPVLHLVGDSTMADKPDLDYPERGWGQLFRNFVRPPLRIVNHAVNGRSTKSFRDRGHWAQVMATLAPGDWVLIEFGHNDSKRDDPSRYTDPTTEFPANLRRYVEEVRARGANPVLATPVVRRAWRDGVLQDLHGAYLPAVKVVAAELHVPLLDLEALTRQLEVGLGEARSKPLFLHFEPGEHPRLPKGLHDNTHSTALGARLIAELAAREMQRMRLPFARDLVVPEPGPWIADAGDGTYRNPILHADYSDPDVIRSGRDFWLTASSFGDAPGLPLLHSRDLVNWELAGHALTRLVPEAKFDVPRHGEGVWAPALREHAGLFWIYYPDPDAGIYVTTALDPRGPWSSPQLVVAGKGLIDPCPLWDDDGRVYLIHAWARSRAGFNNVLTLLELGADGRSVTRDLGIVIDGNQLRGYSTLEGPKLYKRDGWYYVFAPAGGVTTGWQSVFRSRAITGPYESRIVLSQGKTEINGPHQGAWVTSNDGESWFVHFQDLGAYGRVVHLEPMAWKDGWPVMGSNTGAAAESAEVGEPVARHRKPSVAAGVELEPPLQRLSGSQEFFARELSSSWQWSANPAPAAASFDARPGWLRLAAQPGRIEDSAGLLLQRFPAPVFSATTRIELAGVHPGDAGGLIVFGRDYAWIGLRQTRAGVDLVRATAQSSAAHGQETESILAANVAGAVWLRVSVSAGARCRFAYSLDGQSFVSAGEEFPARAGAWTGAKVGLFAQGGPTPGGAADFEYFRVQPAAAR